MMKDRILVVEDSATQAEALRALLEEHEHDVRVARDAEEALSLLRGGAEFDLVLSDVVMPGRSGYDLCREIKALDGQYELPVVLLTSLGDPMDILRGLECGADNYVIKPYQEDLLLARISNVLSKRKLRRASKASLGVSVRFLDTTFTITSDREQILDLFISSIEDIVRANTALQESQRELAQAQSKLEAYAHEMARRAIVSGEKYSTLMQHASDAIFVLDEDGRIVEANTRAGELLGRPADDLHGRPLHAFAAQPWSDRLQGKLARRDVSRVQAHDFMLAHASGRDIHCELSISRGPAAGDQLLLAIVRDITERREAEEAIRVSEERYRLIARTTNDVLWDWNLATDHILWNDAVHTAFRYDPEAVEGSSAWWEARVHPEDRERVLGGLQALVEGKIESWVDEYRFRCGDGGYATVLDRASVLRDETGRPVRAIGSMLDLTARKELEEQLRQAQKMEAVGRLAGGVSHDFNNLLTAIRGYAQLLLADMPSGEPIRDDLEEIDKAASRAAALTGQLLAFSRRQVLQPVVLGLNDVMANMEKMLRRLLRENITLVTEVEPTLGSIRADVGQIEQILMNLVINAGDAMPQGGTLTVETMNFDLSEPYPHRDGVVKPGSYVMLTVSDTGIGMDRETMARIFEPFFTTKGEGRGTGLGLSTVYGIVKQSGGHIWVYSEPGHGTTFKACFPRLDGLPATDGVNGAASIEVPRGSETVLVVEDEDTVRAVLRRTLHRHGYSVLEARNGREALQILDQHPGSIHLVVTDVVMPEIGGPELLERTADRHPDVRALFISGYTEQTMLRRGVLSGRLAFLSKPFTPEALARKVRDVLRNGKPG